MSETKEKLARFQEGSRRQELGALISNLRKRTDFEDQATHRIRSALVTQTEANFLETFSRLNETLNIAIGSGTIEEVVGILDKIAQNLATTDSRPGPNTAQFYNTKILETLFKMLPKCVGPTYIPVVRAILNILKFASVAPKAPLTYLMTFELYRVLKEWLLHDDPRIVRSCFLILGNTINEDRSFMRLSLESGVWGSVRQSVALVEKHADLDEHFAFMCTNSFTFVDLLDLSHVKMILQMSEFVFRRRKSTVSMVESVHAFGMILRLETEFLEPALNFVFDRGLHLAFLEILQLKPEVPMVDPILRVFVAISLSSKQRIDAVLGPQLLFGLDYAITKENPTVNSSVLSIIANILRTDSQYTLFFFVDTIIDFIVSQLRTYKDLPTRKALGCTYDFLRHLDEPSFLKFVDYTIIEEALLGCLKSLNEEVLRAALDCLEVLLRRGFVDTADMTINRFVGVVRDHESFANLQDLQSSKNMGISELANRIICEYFEDQ